MDEGDIIPDVAYGNRNFRIVRKRDATTISPIANVPKRSARCLKEPDGPIHKYSLTNDKLSEITEVKDEDSYRHPLKASSRGTIQMEDVFDLVSHKNPSCSPRKNSVYYSAESSPDRTLVKTEVDIVAIKKENEEDSDVSPVKSLCWFVAEDSKSPEANLVDRARSVRGLHKIDPDLNRPFPSDHVFFSVSSLAVGQLPQPYPPKSEDQSLNFDLPGYVSLPWSVDNIVGNVRRYVQIQRSLQCVQEGIRSINTFAVNVREYADLPRFNALQNYYNALPSDEEREELLSLISKIATLALHAPEVITKPIPHLTLEGEKRSSSRCSISLTQEQCAVILANGFFCTFPEMNEKFGSINMDHVFSLNKPIGQVKLKFIFEYFRAVLKSMPDGVVSFRRVSHKKPPIFVESTLPLPLMEFGEGKIEDYPGAIQVDFANRYIGGGVLNYGAVQEEIMFLQRPEMMVSMLLAPRMNGHEVIFISGAQQFSSYSGYGWGLKWRPLEPNNFVVRDKFKRIQHEIVAVDAKDVSNNPAKQFENELLDRELWKCYAAFHTEEQAQFRKPIATGNWGCGVFGGNLQFKALIQLIAAGATGRDLIYVAFNEERFKNEFGILYECLKEKKVTIGVLYGILRGYKTVQSKFTVFEYVLDCLEGK